MAKQYISVSGVGSPEEVKSIEKMATGSTPADIPVLVGIQATVKSQYFKTENSRGQNWHPVGDTVWPLLQAGSSAVRRIIHYSYSIKSNDRIAVEQTAEMLDRQPECSIIDGWQFNNLAWHKRDFTKTVETAFRQTAAEFLIAQLSGSVLREARPVELARRIGQSGVTHVLLDSSGGVGVAFDPARYLPFIHALQDSGLGIGIAGGLSGESLESFALLLHDYPKLSCDAEAALRFYPEKSGSPGYFSSSVLDLAKVERYLENSVNYMREARCGMAS